MNAKERFDLTHEFARYIVDRFKNPNDWPFAVRLATEALGLDTVTVLLMGNITLYSLCAEVVRTAVEGWEMDAEKIRVGFRRGIDEHTS